MSSHKDSICGIEIGKSLITVAQYFPEENAIGSIVVKPFDRASGTDTDETLKREFKKLITDIELKKQKIVVSLPAEFAIVKTVKLDSDERDVEEAVLWELSQHIIGAIEDYSFDFELLPGAGDKGARHYLAVAYRKSSIRKLVSLLKANKLDPCIVDLDCFAVINAFEANYVEKLSSPAVIIIGTEEKSKIILSHGGSLVDYEVVVHDRDAVSPQEYATRLTESLSHLCAQPMEGSPEIYCSGPLFSQSEFIDSLAQKFGKAEVLNPFRKIGCRAVQGENDITQFAAQLSVAVGLALRGQMGL